MILLLAAAARVYGIGRQSLWFDEAATLHIVQQPLPRMFELIKFDERTPPLHYLLLHFWIKLFGNSEMSLRLPSAIAGVATVYVLYLLTRDLLGAGAGLAAAFVFAINRYQIAYSQEARAYELMVFLGLLSTLLFVRLLRRPAARTHAAYVIITALLLYAHLYGIFVIAAQHVAWVFAWRRGNRALPLRRWAMLSLAVLALFSTWIPTSIHWAREVQQSFWIPPLRMVDLFNTYRAYAGSTPMLILLAALALLGVRRAARRRSLVLLAALALLPVVVPIGVSILTTPTFTPRYGLVALAGWIALAGAGLLALPKLPLRVATLAALAFFAATATLPRLDKPQWREAGAYLEDHMESTDIAVMSRKNATYLYDYYVHRSDVHRFGFDGSALPVTLPLPPGKHVWLILHDNPFPRERILARGGWRVLSSRRFRGVEIIELR